MQDELIWDIWYWYYWNLISCDFSSFFPPSFLTCFALGLFLSRGWTQQNMLHGFFTILFLHFFRITYVNQSTNQSVTNFIVKDHVYLPIDDKTIKNDKTMNCYMWICELNICPCLIMFFLMLWLKYFCTVTASSITGLLCIHFTQFKLDSCAKRNKCL